jgi:integrase
MGQLYKRGDTWHADYFDRDGIRRRISTRTTDVKVARARLRELELATTDRAARETETLDQALIYFVDVVHAASSAGTIRCYRQKARHLSRLLGGTLLDALSREQVERYIAARLDEAAHTHSIHKELVVLRGTLASARDRDRFHGANAVVPPFSADYTPRTSYLTPDQFASLAQHLCPRRQNLKPGPLERWERRRDQRVLYCLLIAFASPRVGELHALRWEHIDRARGVLRIPRGKTVSRTIAIHPMLLPWLERLDAGTGPVVEPWRNVGRDLPAACARAGVPRCTPNDLRRTFASWLVQGGAPLMVVSRLLGHSSTRMVDLVYGQLDEATLLGAIARLPGGCDAGVTRGVPTRGTGGAVGTAAASPSIADSVGNPVDSAGCVVPRDGVEPPTRGFSVLASISPRTAQVSEPKRKSAPRLRVVK